MESEYLTSDPTSYNVNHNKVNYSRISDTTRKVPTNYCIVGRGNHLIIVLLVEDINQHSTRGNKKRPAYKFNSFVTSKGYT